MLVSKWLGIRALGPAYGEHGEGMGRELGRTLIGDFGDLKETGIINGRMGGWWVGGRRLRKKACHGGGT